MHTRESDELIGTIAGRAELLRALRGGPKAKGDLVRELPDSRSTVDRAVRELEAAGFLDRGSRHLELTLAGELIVAEYERFADGISGIQAARELLHSMPTSADLDPAVFRGATVASQTEYAPHKPVADFKNLLRGADRIRGVSSIVLPDYVDLYSRQIVEDGMEVDLVVSDEVLGALLDGYRDPMEASLATGRLQLRVVDRNPPFSTILSWHDDPVLAIVVYGEGGTTGVIRNSSDEAIEWGREWIDKWESRAEPVPEPSAFGGT